jgi:hypothetical protein
MNALRNERGKLESDRIETYGKYLYRLLRNPEGSYVGNLQRQIDSIKEEVDIEIKAPEFYALGSSEDQGSVDVLNRLDLIFPKDSEDKINNIPKQITSDKLKEKQNIYILLTNPGMINSYKKEKDFIENTLALINNGYVYDKTNGCLIHPDVIKDSGREYLSPNDVEVNLESYKFINDSDQIISEITWDTYNLKTELIDKKSLEEFSNQAQAA